MEVFLRNLPRDLSDDGLRDALAPIMSALNIGDWMCRKPRNRTHSLITFLEEPDGKRFLEKHQEHAAQPLQSNRPQRHRSGKTYQARLRPVARLELLQMPIYVKMSKHPADESLLRHLEYERERRAQAPEPKPAKPTVACKITQLSCGHNLFLSEGDIPTFVEQTTMTTIARAKVGRRFLVITFPDAARINISFDTVESWVVNHSSATLTMVLREPPRCFQGVDDLGDSLIKGPKIARCLHVPSWPGHARYIASCLVYQISFASNFDKLVEHLKPIESVSLDMCDMAVVTTPRPLTEDYQTAYRALERRLSALECPGSTLPYPIRFQVHALVDDAYFHPFNALKLLNLMEDAFSSARANGHPVPFSVKSVRPLFENIPFACPGHQAMDFDAELLMEEILTTEASYRQAPPESDSVYGSPLPPNQVWVFKAIVTPTRIRLEGPEPESKNRVMRMHMGQTDYFLRVMFCDEDGQDLQTNINVTNDDVFRRYNTVFGTGIRAAGRHFSFLGFSHSSLRAHSAWFVAPFTDNENHEIQNSQTILKSLGNFAGIRVPAKCAARIGQAFSETPYAIGLSVCGIRVIFIDDIKSADGSRVFSDGVGTVSQDALEEIWQHLPGGSAASTCLQIRLGGVKGILSLDSELCGKVICIRKESMMKFESDNMNELGICDTASRPLRMYLNRQMIKIMEDMGTCKEWFLRQLRKAMEELQEAAVNPAQTGSFLESQSIGINMGFPWLIQQLHKSGVDFHSDKFLRCVLEHAILRELRRLKHRANIAIDQGVTLFGVMDEYGFLEEGQIYVAYDRKHRIFSGCQHIPLRDGRVIVTRSPALHPGDVRVVQHVTPPAKHPLRSLRNCVVFSQKGSRDLPSQLSGGDLDGDLYSVIWDAKAIPVQQFPPADYPRVAAKSLDRDVTQKDIADFFVNFMETDILGVIATRHQVFADIRSSGTLDVDCIKLAEMHSAAVDYSKTGESVELISLPKAPKTRPDFLAPTPPSVLYDPDQLAHVEADESDEEADEEGLGRTKPKYHKSKKILGELYRAVDERKIWKDYIAPRADETFNRRQSVWPQVLELIESRTRALGLQISFEHKLQEARKIRELYESAMSDQMWQYSESSRKSLSEQEVFCGSILNKKSAQTRRQRDASSKLRDVMERISAWVVNLIRGRSKADDGNSSHLEGADEPQKGDGLELSWACLVVATSREKSSSKSRPRSQDLQSFAVVAACCAMKELDQMSKVLGQATHRKQCWISTG